MARLKSVRLPIAASCQRDVSALRDPDMGVRGPSVWWWRRSSSETEVRGRAIDHRGGRHVPPRRRLQVLGAVLVLATALTSCEHGARATLGSSKRSTPPTTVKPAATTTATSPTTSVPKIPAIDDLTWISDAHGWALIGQPQCGTCRSTVLTTTDGGALWTQVGSIASVQCGASCADNGPGAFHIRFANSSDGYAFDPDLFVTTDGGRSWSEEQGPPVAGLEIVGSSVIRVSFSHSGCPGPCNLSVDEASVGSSSWTHLFAVPMLGDSDAVQLVRQGPSDVYLAVFQNPAGGAQSEQTFLFISHDGGVTWSPRSDPCGSSGQMENDTVAMAAAPGEVMAVLCVARLGTTGDFVNVSSDGGKSFASTAPLPAIDGYHLVAVTSADGLFVATDANGGGSQVLEASFDGGRSWAQAAIDTKNDSTFSSSDAGFLGFESSRVGRWVGSPGDVWTTTDGGLTWSSRPI
jgi:photosystem II stability/assembly factor-like uncharacterized protein